MELVAGQKHLCCPPARVRVCTRACARARAHVCVRAQSSKRLVHVDLQGNELGSMKVKGLPRPEGIAVSDDGRWLAIASEPNTVALYAAGGACSG